MHLQWQRWFAALAIVSMLLVLLGCDAPDRATAPGMTSAVATASAAPGNQAAIASPTVPLTNTISFKLTGAVQGSYSITSTALTSKLRHGHREFTIEVDNSGQSVIMAFYGYDGPAAYTLDGVVNGGDVRVDPGKGSLPGQTEGATAWDLPQRQSVSCALRVSSDTPTQYTGIDRLLGSFSCPFLASTNPVLSHKSVALDQGRFDLFILVES
jgi:hypothetical protein